MLRYPVAKWTIKICRRLVRTDFLGNKNREILMRQKKSSVIQNIPFILVRKQSWHIRPNQEAN